MARIRFIALLFYIIGSWIFFARVLWKVSPVKDMGLRDFFRWRLLSTPEKLSLVLIPWGAAGLSYGFWMLLMYMIDAMD